MINTEQLSAARHSQLEAQLTFFDTVSTRAVSSAAQLLTLNLSLTRDTMEKSSAALRQVLTARDAADLFALTARAPDTFGKLLAYGQQWFAIATGGAPRDVAQADSGKREVLAEIEHVPAAALAPLAAPEREPAPAQAAAVDAEAAPPLSATPIAKALGSVGAGHGAAVPVAAPFPAADEVQLQVTGIKPVDAAPPPAPVAGTPEIVQEAPAAKGRRKK